MKIFTLILIIEFIRFVEYLFSGFLGKELVDWIVLTNYSLAINSNGDIFAGADTSYGVFRSTDNGDNWTSGLDTLQITGIVIKPNGEILVSYFGLSPRWWCIPLYG